MKPEIYGDGYKMPAGDYFICDPSFILEEDDMDEFFQAIGSYDVNEVCAFQFDSGSWIVAMHVLSGEESVFDRDGNEYPISELVMGIIPIDDMDKYKGFESDAVGMIHHFDEDFVVDNIGGLLVFGDVAINTRFSDDMAFDF